MTHLLAEVGFDLLEADVGVFHHVVQEPGGDHRGAGADVPQQIRHSHRVNDVRLTGGPHLAPVQLEGEIKGGGQQRLRIGGTGLPTAGGNVLDAMAEPFRQGDAVLVGTEDFEPQLGGFRRRNTLQRRGCGGYEPVGSIQHGLG